MPKIMIELEGPALTEDELQEMRYMLAAALGEYRDNRGPSAKEYVARRYADQSDTFRLNKAARVSTACNIARRLHNGALQAKQEE